MTFDQFVSSSLLMLLSGGVYALWKLYGAVNTLNTSMAVVISELTHHDKRISRLEQGKKSKR